MVDFTAKFQREQLTYCLNALSVVVTVLQTNRHLKNYTVFQKKFTPMTFMITL